MDVLAWLAFPLIATAAAMCWAAWWGHRHEPRGSASRSSGRRRGGDPFSAVEEFRRFTAALSAPGPQSGDGSPTRRRRLSRRAS